MSEVKKGFFAENFGASSEQVEEKKKDIIGKKIARRLASAYDDAIGKKMDAEDKLIQLRFKFTDYDVNAILEQQSIMRKCDVICADIAAEYEFMMGEPLK